MFAGKKFRVDIEIKERLRAYYENHVRQGWGFGIPEHFRSARPDLFAQKILCGSTLETIIQNEMQRAFRKLDKAVEVMMRANILHMVNQNREGKPVLKGIPFPWECRLRQEDSRVKNSST